MYVLKMSTPTSFPPSIGNSGNNNNNNQSQLFIEILPEKGEEVVERPRLIQAYVAVVTEPKHCGPLLKHLNHVLPLSNTIGPQNNTHRKAKKGEERQEEIIQQSNLSKCFSKFIIDLSHLKRVKKPILYNNYSISNCDPSTQSPPIKKQKKYDEVINSHHEKTNDMAGQTITPQEKKETSIPYFEILLRDVKSLEHEYHATNSSGKRDYCYKDHVTAATTTNNIQEYAWKKYISTCKNLSLSCSSSSSSLTTTIRIAKRMIPGRPPESKQEWRDFSYHHWPTSYFPKRTKEYKAKQLELSSNDIEQMIWGMEQAIHDRCHLLVESSQALKNTTTTSASRTVPTDSKQQCNSHLSAGTVVVDPIQKAVVSRATEERILQLQHKKQLRFSRKSESTDNTANSTFSRSVSASLAKKNRELQSATILENPLATSILLAIQGVSRKERQIAIQAEGGMASSEFQQGQYLCTGFDVYTTHEATTFEAMALVHSRIRRLIYGISSNNADSGIENMYIHALPSTNHHYRAFACRSGSELWNKCQTKI